MTKRLAGTDPVRRLLFGVLIGVTLCGCAGPPKQEYFLGAATAPKAASVVQTALRYFRFIVSCFLTISTPCFSFRAGMGASCPASPLAGPSDFRWA
jgi:hypothetical protein